MPDRPTRHHAPREGLSDDDQAVLAFERQWWRYAGSKDIAIREAFGVSAAEHYRRLTRLLDRPEALAADPLLVRRLRRQRSRRTQQRSAARRGSA